MCSVLREEVSRSIVWYYSQDVRDVNRFTLFYYYFLNRVL